MVIYVGKDLLVAVVYLSFFIAYQNKRVVLLRPPFRIPLLVFFCFCTFQVLNPASTSIFFGLLGMKLYFYYVPLLFVGYGLVRTEVELNQCFRLLMVLTIFVTVLGVVQAIAGPTFLNPTVIQEDIRELSTNYRVAPLTGELLYRPTSVFVSAGRFSFFLVPAWILSYGYTGYLLLRSPRGRNLTFTALALTTAAVVMCGSRGSLLWTAGSAIVMTPLLLRGAPWAKGQKVRIMRTIQRTAIAGVIAVIFMMAVYPEAINSRLNFYWQTLDPNGSASELLVRTRNYPLQELQKALDDPRWQFGYGIGTSSLGLQYISRILHVPPMRVGVENGYGALILELGILGLLLFLILAASVVKAACKTTLTLRGTPGFTLGLAISWYSVLFLFFYHWGGFQSFQDFILSSFLWLFLGVLFRLPKLSAEVQAASVPMSNEVGVHP
jgi:O-antigen ligase